MKRVVFLRNKEFAVLTVTRKEDAGVTREFAHQLGLQEGEHCFIRNIPMDNNDIVYLQSILTIGGTPMALFLGRLIDSISPVRIRFWQKDNTMRFHDKELDPIRRLNGDDKHIIPNDYSGIARVIGEIFGRKSMKDTRASDETSIACKLF